MSSGHRFKEGSHIHKQEGQENEDRQSLPGVGEGASFVKGKHGNEPHRNQGRPALEKIHMSGNEHRQKMISLMDGGEVDAEIRKLSTPQPLPVNKDHGQNSKIH